MRVGIPDRSRFPFVLICLALLVAHRAQAEEPLRINQSSSWPISDPSGAGFFDRIVSEALGRLDREVEFQRLPSERSLINASTGLDDGDGPRIDGLARHYPGLVQVPEPVVRFEFVAFSRDPSLVIEEWDDLVGRDVAIIRGWKILERSIEGAASLVRVRTAERLMEMLRLDRTEVVVVERWMGLALAGQVGVEGLQVHEPPLAVREMYLYLHERHAGLAPRLAEQLRAVKRDGTYETVAREVLGVGSEGLVLPGHDSREVVP